jgi:hypothetical protein
MSDNLYVIIENPNSGALAYLNKSLADSVENSFFFILPKSLNSGLIQESYSQKIIFWNDRSESKICYQSENWEKGNDFFLFFSPFLDLSDQFESLIQEIELSQSFRLARVISFIDASILINEMQIIQDWIDGAAHFSDALCVTNRNNQNGSEVNKLFKRYEQLRYPMEKYTISLSQKGKVSGLLSESARRISHIFDPIDLLEEDDKPDSDIYLAKSPNGNRKKKIPLPFLL